MKTIKRFTVGLAACVLCGAAAASPPYLSWYDVRDDGPNDHAWDVAVNEWGDTIVVSDGLGSAGCRTTKYDPFGHVVWSDAWGGTNDLCSHVVTGKWGAVFVGGSDGSDFRVIRYGNSGSLDWAVGIGSTENDVLIDLVVDPAGLAPIGVGQFGSSGFQAHDAAVVKWLPGGLEDWRWSWAPGNSIFYAAAVAPDGSIVATGDQTTLALTVKLTPTGSMAWVQQGAAGTEGRSVAVDSAGNVVVTGRWQDPGGMIDTARTWSYGAGGAPRWDKVDPDPGYIGKDVVTDAAGNVFVIADSTTSGASVHVTKYDVDGHLMWLKEFDSPAPLDHAVEARVDGAGSVHVGVLAEYSNTDYDAWLVSWRSDGTLRWEELFTAHDSKLAGIDVFGSQWLMFSGSARSDSNNYADLTAARYGTWVFDPFESDWQWTHGASWLQPGGSSGGRTFQGDPVDWMSFHAHAGETYEVRAMPTGASLGGVNVTLVSPDGADELAAAMPGSDGTLLRFTAAAPGTYHLRFEPAGGETGDDTDYAVDVAGNARVSSLYSRTFADGTVEAGDAVQLADGGIAVVGGMGTDAVVARLDPLGNVEWASGYGTAGMDRARAALTTRDGMLAVVGDTGAPGEPADAFGMEIDPATGTVVRAWILGGAGDDLLTAVAHEPMRPATPTYPPDPVTEREQGWVAGGRTDSWGMGGEDGLLLRADHDGGLQWAMALGGPLDERVGALALGPDRSILAVGAAAGRALVARVEGEGTLSWARTLAGTTPGDWSLGAVTVLADGGFVAAGYAPSPLGLPETDLWVVRCDQLGFPRWSRLLVADGDQSAAGIAELADGNLAVVGSTRAPGGDSDGWVVRFDREGDLLSQQSFGGPGDDVLTGVERREGLGFVAAGTRGVPGAGGQGWLLAADANGELRAGCALVADTTATVADVPVTSDAAEVAPTSIPAAPQTWDVVAQGMPVPVDPECELLEPREVTGLRFPSKTSMVWDADADADGYVVVRGDLASLAAGDWGTPFAEVGTPRASDDEDPAPGEGRQYLLRAQNALGTGPSGFTSAGIPRSH